MGIRIQPREIEVPEADPFRNDLLGRRESVEVLTHLVGSLEGPCVLAVDAAWGNGKTTFLRIWAQYLRKQEFPIVTFNAWETDFSEDPFVALSTELTEGLQEYDDELLVTKIADTKERAKEVLRRAVPGLFDSQQQVSWISTNYWKRKLETPLHPTQKKDCPHINRHRSQSNNLGIPCKAWRMRYQNPKVADP